MTAAADSAVGVSDAAATASSEPPSPSASGGIIHIGIDLGTSRSSIAASNGVRATVASYVGYPKDPIARKRLGTDILFGQDALDNRLACDTYRPLADGVINDSHPDTGAKNARAAADLLRHIVRLADPRPDQLVYAVIGAPAEASVHSKQAILDAARDVVDSVMITSEPFAVAYGLDVYDEALVIDIGAGTTDLCRIHGVLPEASDQITLTAAGDAIDAALEEELAQHCPGAAFSRNMVKQLKERHGALTHAGRVSATFPVNGVPTEFDVTDAVSAACERIVIPIVDAVGSLIGSFDPEFQDRLRNRVILAGGGSQILGLAERLEVGLQRLGGGHVERVEEPVYAGANGALKLAHDMPADYWEQLRA